MEPVEKVSLALALAEGRGAGGVAMNSRERVMKAIEFGGPDRIPIITWRTEGFDYWLGYKGHERYRSQIEKILEEYPGDVYYVDTPWIGQGAYGPDIGSETPDEWGTVWTILEVGCIETGNPLADWGRLDTCQFPDPLFYVPPEAKEAVRRHRNEEYVYVGTFGGYFQQMASLRGFENLMVDLITGPRELFILADRLLEYFLQLIGKWAEIGVDGMFFGDDWGTQERLMIRPSLWREFFKPRYEEMFDAVHQAGAHVWLHSDGYIMDIIPDFIEIGVDVLNVNQLSVNGIDELGERFGGKVCFLGGLDQQRILPLGSVEEVERHVKRVVQALAGYGGGYIAVALSGGGADTPFANLKAALDAFTKYGTYPIETKK